MKNRELDVMAFQIDMSAPQQLSIHIPTFIIHKQWDYTNILKK